MAIDVDDAAPARRYRAVDKYGQTIDFLLSWLQVFRSADAMRLGHGGRHTQQTAARPSEKCVARCGSVILQQVRAIGKTCNQLDGTVKTAEGVFQLQLPHVWGLRAPYRSKLWAALSRTSDVLTAFE